MEIDPINNTSNVVFESTALDSAFSTGIRGLYVYDNQLIMSMSSDTSDIKGVRDSYNNQIHHQVSGQK